MLITIQKESLCETPLRQLIALSAQWEEEDSCFGYRTNTIADIEPEQIFTAREEGELVGYLLCHTHVSEKESCTIQKGSVCLEIEELYVVRPLRSQGIGGRLFHVAVEAMGAGCDFVTLSTATKNHRAILHFYIDELGMTFWNARLFMSLKQ